MGLRISSPLHCNGARQALALRHISDEAEQTLFAYYCERLEEYGALDYDDLILQTLALFEQGALAGQEREPFRRLLVDEFQDINPMQYRLVRAWNRDGDELFVIGDPDQDVYKRQAMRKPIWSRQAPPPPQK